MATTTQRLKYFTGEFLQSGDFTDEQSYHVATRRLLNLELHLHGIVRGAHIVIDQNSVAPVEFLSVAPGFVIDQIGREIYVSAPYSLTPLLSRAGLQLGLNELWIVYTETASGSPAPGYQLCNQLSQNTRWTESFDLMLRSLVVAPDPNTPNPNLDLKGICLGLVKLHYDSTNGWYFTRPSDWYRRRHYAKIRAQSIIAPDDVDPDPITLDGPNVLPPDGYIHIKTPTGVYSEGNLLVRNNILVGDDFTIQNTSGSPPPPLTPPTNLNGNLKLNSDIYLNGTIYTPVKGNWLSLDERISRLASTVSDIQFVAPVNLLIDGQTGTTFPVPPAVITGTANTTLAHFSNVEVQPY
ncbi:MAG: hypothetical protein WCC64_17050, partial [Aliidongia sp.]